MTNSPSSAAHAPVLARRRLALLLVFALGLPALALLGRHLLAATLPAAGLLALAWLLWAFFHALHGLLWQQAMLSELAARAYAEALGRRSASAPDGAYRSLEDTPAYAPPSWLPAYARTGQHLLLFAGVAASAWFGWLAWGSPDTLSALTTDGLRLLAILSALGAALAAFLASYLRAVGGDQPAADSGFAFGAALRALVLLAAVLALATTTRLFAQVNLDRVLVPLLLLVLASLLLEGLCAQAIALFRRPAAATSAPGTSERLPAALGRSLLLDAFGSMRHPLDLAVERLQSGLGVRLDTSWIHQFLRRRLGWIAASALGALWLTTVFTVVPAESRGVRLHLGRIDGEALPPGLHRSLPWPFGRIELVATERLRELTLGFDDDLGGAILWSRKHYEGERNLLVGGGAELLTINVPIHYRVTDPLLQVRSARDPETLLRSVAEACLVRLAVTRDAYRLMLGERAELATRLHTDIQHELDALRSGIELVWLGFKDIHPPVEVTAAYQEVVGALDERETAILQARAERAATVPAARQKAARLRIQAEAAGRERALLAAADQAPVRSLAALPAHTQAGWREVRHLEALEDVLPRLRSLVVTPESAPGAEPALLDLRPPTVLPTVSSPDL